MTSPGPLRRDLRRATFEDATPAAHVSTRRRRRWPWIVLGSFVAAIGVVVGVAAVYANGLSQSFDKAERVPVAQIFPEPETRPVEVNPDALNILLLGSDSRSGLGSGDLADIDGQRTDTIMLVHVPADRASAQVISVMRDNWVEIPGYGMHKINAAVYFGGVPLLIQTLEGILDVQIDHVGIIDFEGFQGLTEALDGVMFHNEIQFSDRGYTYAAGEITLRGEAALQYVRARYPFYNADYQRVKNQRAFMHGVFTKFLSAETLTNPGRIAAVVDAVSPYLIIDDGLTMQRIIGLAFELRELRPRDITYMTAPTLGTGQAGGQSIVRPDWEGLAQLSEALKNDTVAEFAAQYKQPG